MMLRQGGTENSHTDIIFIQKDGRYLIIIARNMYANKEHK